MGTLLLISSYGASVLPIVTAAVLGGTLREQIWTLTIAVCLDRTGLALVIKSEST